MIKGSDIAVGRTKRAALGQKFQSLEASLARSAASYWPAALRPRPQRSPRLNLRPEVFLNTPTRDPRPGRFCCASRPFLKPQRTQPHHLNNLLHNCAQPPATFEKLQNASPAPPRPPGYECSRKHPRPLRMLRYFKPPARLAGQMSQSVDEYIMRPLPARVCSVCSHHAAGSEWSTPSAAPQRRPSTPHNPSSLSRFRRTVACLTVEDDR